MEFVVCHGSFPVEAMCLRLRNWPVTQDFPGLLETISQKVANNGPMILVRLTGFNPRQSREIVSAVRLQPNVLFVLVYFRDASNVGYYRVVSSKVPKLLKRGSALPSSAIHTDFTTIKNVA